MVKITGIEYCIAICTILCLFRLQEYTIYKHRALLHLMTNYSPEIKITSSLSNYSHIGVSSGSIVRLPWGGFYSATWLFDYPPVKVVSG